MISFAKIKNSYKFLLIVSAVYLVVSFFNANFARTGIQNTITVLIKIFPIFLLILLITFLVNRYFKINKVVRYLGENSGKKGLFYSIIFGILVSGPPYLLFPLLKDLKEKGMKESLIAVFLYNRNVKIPFLPITIYYFGPIFTLILSVYIILFSILNGLLIDYFMERRGYFWKLKKF